MDWIASAANWLRELLVQQAWLHGFKPAIESAPDWVLLASPAGLLAVVLLLFIALPRRARGGPRSERPDWSTGSTRDRKLADVLTLPRASLIADEDNSSVRVFVSSTFLDMQRERDILVKEMFPALRVKLRPRGVEIFEVDLRWGITREQSEQGQTLPTLLAEIDRCRPWFIGLIGDRYGWTPPEPALTEELKAAYPSLRNAAGASVTEIEIIQGVLSDPECAKRSFFFERDPAYDWKATLTQTESANVSPTTDNERAKLVSLKARIRDSGAVIQTYGTPEDIGSAVEAALAGAIEGRFPAAAALDPYTQALRLHRAYARERRGLHIGARQYLARLDQWAGGVETMPLLITGASGGGKSTLIANWLQTWRSAHPADIVLEHYLGASPDSADPLLLMRRFWEHLNRATGESVDLPGGDAGLMDVSAGLARRLELACDFATSVGSKIVVVLDGLDKLSSEQNLRWLPSMPRVKLLVSSLDGEAKGAALLRGWLQLKITPLNDAEQREFIDGTLASWGKKLVSRQIAGILAHAQAGNPLFLRTVLEELRVSATYHQLDDRLEIYLKAKDLPDLFARMLERLEADCEPGLVARALPLIWASRAGLEEAEIVAIAKTQPLFWATLRNALSDSMRDQAGRLTFSHDYLRKAIQARYLASDEAQRAAHLAIANRFDQREPDARQTEELPYQLRAAHAWDRLSSAPS